MNNTAGTCPGCGETSGHHIESEEYSDESTRIITCTCDCGCKWDETYSNTPISIEILRETRTEETN
mgnify:CR=1 FL=1